MKQNEFRNHAELIRLQTTKLVNMAGRSLQEGKNLTPQELWRFEWDNVETLDRESEGLTDDKITEHNNRLLSSMNKTSIINNQ